MRTIVAIAISIFILFPMGSELDAIWHKPQTYNVIEYGAVPDGKTLNTSFIQEAINVAHKNGGGKVILSEGKYLSGSIVLKSGVTIYLEKGATLLGSTNPAHYKEINNWGALILAENATDIGIAGIGTIDGQGRALALNVDSLHHTGAMIDENYNYRRMRPNELRRPELIRMIGCNRIDIEGVTLLNASSWVQTYEQCAYLKIYRVKIESRAYWNNDGIDIVDCHHVRITHCDVNAADDGICIKSHTSDQINDQIYIAHCTIRSSASAVKFGTASHGGFKNIIIEDIMVFDTFRSAIAIESVDGGLIDSISISDITAINTANAIFIRLGHRSGDQPGIVRNITIKNMVVQVPFGRPDLEYDMRGPEVDFFHNPFPSSIVGIPGHFVENVVLENILIIYPGRASKGMAYVPIHRLDQVPEEVERYPEFSMFGELPAWGIYVRHARGIKMKNIKLVLESRDFRPAFVFDDVKGMHLELLDLPVELDHQVIFKGVTDVDLDDQVTEQLVEVDVDIGEVRDLR